MNSIKKLFIAMTLLVNSARGVFIDIASEESFNAKLAENNRPIIIKFAADWCSACQSIAQPFKEIAENSAFNYIDFYHIDIDKMPDLTKKYGVIGIPTFVFVHNKKEIMRESGVKDPADFKSYFSKRITHTFPNLTSK